MLIEFIAAAVASAVACTGFSDVLWIRLCEWLSEQAGALEAASGADAPLGRPPEARERRRQLPAP